jgi:hypothetical protein
MNNAHTQISLTSFILIFITTTTTKQQQTQMGLWGDNLVFTFNLFLRGRTYSGAAGMVIKRGDLMNGILTSSTYKFIPMTTTTYISLLPGTSILLERYVLMSVCSDSGRVFLFLIAFDKMCTDNHAPPKRTHTHTYTCTADVDGPDTLATQPPSTSPPVLMTVTNGALIMWRVNINWGGTDPKSGLTLSAPISIPIATYTSLCTGTRECVPQPDTTYKLDAISPRLMNRLAYRRFATYDALVVTHSVQGL